MTNFLELYKKYMSDIETPVDYDVWTALWCVSVAAGRSIVVDRPRIPVHLNLYVILMDESGLTRKSTAVRMATKLVQDVCPETYFITTSVGSTEALEWTIHELSRDKGRANIAISASELVRLLGRRTGTTQLPGLLVDLYDCPDKYESPGTGSRGPIVFKDVYILFLAAADPVWLTRSIHPDVLDGGFTSRFACIHSAKRKKKVPWPSDSEANLDELKSKLNHIKHRARTVSTIQLTDAARGMFVQWYKKRKASHDVYSRTFEAREDDHVLRIAGLLCMVDDRWEIGEAHIKEALRLVNKVKKQGAVIFSGEEGAGDVASIGRLRTILLQCKGNPVTTTYLYKMVRPMTAARLDSVLRIMHELDLVKKFQHKDQKRGRPASMWVATKGLRSARTVEEIDTIMRTN